MSLVDLGKQLLEASKLGKTEDVRALMTNGAPFTTDWLGSSPLHFAVQFGQMETVEVLLRAGISRDARTKVDRTPLHIAAQEGHVMIVELLLSNGADIEAKDMLRMTPLHWAVEKGHIDVAQLLLSRGATISTENKFEKTALDIAISNGRADIAGLLQMSGNLVDMNSEENIVVEEVTTTETSIAVSGITIPDAGKIIHRYSLPISLGSSGATMIKTEAEDIPDGNGTTVLATLAALAEATSANNTTTTHTEALSWLETHGITMMSSGDDASLVASTLEGGQTLVLTEAGKLALKIAKHEESSDDGDSAISQSKIVTIVTGGDQFIPSGNGSPTIFRLSADGTTLESQSFEIGANGARSLALLTEEDGNSDLRRQLKEVQREAREYKIQLQKKEQEAEVYKKQLGLSKTSKLS